MGSIATDGGSPPKLVGYQDRVVGSLIGCMCGDVIGSVVEGWTPGEIVSTHKEGLVDVTTAANGRGGGRYTDDTLMTIALAKSLVDKGCCDAVDAAKYYMQMFDPHRGYGGGALQVMWALQKGADPRTTGTKFIEGGSFGNGGAMRISPVALAYRNAPPRVLANAVEAALLCTHVHPLGIDGAYIQAAAISWLSKADPSTATPRGLLDHLVPLAETDEMQEILTLLQGAAATLEQLPQNQAQVESWGAFLGSAAWSRELAVAGSASSNSGFQIKATDATGAALVALCCHWSFPQDCVVAAVHYGGDTDTIAAMAGALTGALHGVGWVPDRWWGKLENGVDGRDTLVDLGMQLSGLDVTA